ncbi:MAG: hypothetical protein GXY19_06110 [Phycisphaerae bacterium]|nr:hypothetical protein [Phycisphaerae bacterium]
MGHRQDETPAPRDRPVKGLPMFTASAPEALAQEKAELAALSERGVLGRWRGYLDKTGPGWLQSALVLGSGSAGVAVCRRVSGVPSAVGPASGDGAGPSAPCWRQSYGTCRNMRWRRA